MTINNSWKNLRYGKFPMGIGNSLTFEAHKPVKSSDFSSTEELLTHIETTIKSSIKI